MAIFQFIVFVIGLIGASSAHALPIPELAGAAFGIWELAMGLLALLSIWWPWRQSTHL